MEERLRNAVAEAYTKEGKGNSVERDLLLLRRNKMVSLSQWASLSNEDKKKYPDGLKVVLNNTIPPKGKWLLFVDMLFWKECINVFYLI